MNLRRLHFKLVGFMALASACATPTGDHTNAGAEGNTTPPTDGRHSSDDAEPSDSTRASIAIGRSMHAASMTEVVLEPRGTAALTLDEDGGVRIWSSLLGDGVETPLELPVREPAWMSMARRGDTSLVASFIDTAGGAQIGRIDTSEPGGTWTPLFDHPPTRPLFELHVLDGGKRIVALSVDHQIELWTPQGKIVAEIDQSGFVPWQLWVSQPSEGGSEILAVFGRPVRVQKVALHDDALSIEGEARPVDMDRGPNRNDLVMSPDGEFVTVLRRPMARGKRFEGEITRKAPPCPPHRRRAPADRER